MTATEEMLRTVMSRAVAYAVEHVEADGLPFVGVVVDDHRAISDPGVNTVRQTGDPTAHAEIVAMRQALRATGRKNLSGTSLLATGEPCGMCYRHAIRYGITEVYVAVDRETVASLGFDYLASYPAFGITEERRAWLHHPLRVPGDREPFIRYLSSAPTSATE